METVSLPRENLEIESQFDIPGLGTAAEFELTDEEFLAAACGAIADIINKHERPTDEGGLTNEEIFARLQGVFDVASERYSADEARMVETGMRLMEAIGHAACGNHELMGGAQQRGLLPESAAEQHAGHAHDEHESSRTSTKTELKGNKKDTKKKKRKRPKR